ncbi:hypothetical protein ACFWP0_20470 [Achromobacter sp. NPDC058515]|uniref:hypothetical protein n=1 Tax=Achromobacter sp. NPDC058515 TaxID=3346533 RepID=UPI00365C7A36
MSTKLSASRLIALTACALKQQGARLMTSAPWSLAVFVLSLPIVLLAPRLIELAHPGLVALVAVVNLLALVRVSMSWHRLIALSGPAEGPAWRLGRAGWKYLGLVVVFAVVAAALVSANDVMPFLVYVALNNVGGDVLFFGSVLAAWAVMWGGVPYVLGTFALSLPRVAVSGKYDFLRMRKLRASIWPLVGVQLMLIGSAALARDTLSRAMFARSGGSFAFGSLGILFCAASVLMATAMCAVAYRELARGAGDGAA